MPNDADIKAKFWKALRSDMTLMLGLDGVPESHAQPMTAQLDGDGDHGPIWFFTSREAKLLQEMRETHNGVAHFVSRGHDLFATIHGNLVLDNHRATIDRLWNRYVAAWFDGGRDDPRLQLIRFDPEHAQIWLNDSTILAGAKILLGGDPKANYGDRVAEVSLV